MRRSRGAMAHDAVTELSEDTAWGDLDTVVVDLPLRTGEIVLTALHGLPVDGPDPESSGRWLAASQPDWTT
jgi:Mrp family chromosome partitioning ATPase